MVSTLAFLLVHGAALWASVHWGGWLAAEVLSGLRLANPGDGSPPGAWGAGRTIGRAERFLVYLAILAEQPALLAALVGLKTLVRYPEVQEAARHENAEGAGRFAEYYLVGTLVSLSVGVACPLTARALLRWFGVE